MSALERFADLSRQSLELAGNTPLVLDDPRWMYVVAAGRVELFVVKLEDAGPVGVRHHLVSLSPDRACFGAAPHPAGYGLLAVGGWGSRLERIDLAELRRRLAQDSDHLGQAAGELIGAYMRAAAVDACGSGSSAGSGRTDFLGRRPARAGHSG